MVLLVNVCFTGLVVLTAMAGYAMAPAAFDPIGFTMVTIGTGLTSASANAINQVTSISSHTNEKIWHSIIFNAISAKNP
jgi:heme O synthase-like polyprenyltransferase